MPAIDMYLRNPSQHLKLEERTDSFFDFFWATLSFFFGNGRSFTCRRKQCCQRPIKLHNLKLSNMSIGTLW